jgi:hypothetical protein
VWAGSHPETTGSGWSVISQFQSWSTSALSDAKQHLAHNKPHRSVSRQTRLIGLMQALSHQKWIHLLALPG